MPTKFYSITEVAHYHRHRPRPRLATHPQRHLPARRIGHFWVITSQGLAAFRRRKRRRGQSWSRRGQASKR